LTSGTSGVGFYRTAGSGNFSQSGLVNFPSYTINWNPVTIYQTAAMGISGAPELGTTYNPTVSGALGNTFAILVSGTSSPGVIPLPGAPGCNLLTAPEATAVTITDVSGSAQLPIVVPNSIALEGINVYHQWAIWDPTVNNLGIVLSNGGISTLGN
jgi:hypothetical protein